MAASYACCTIQVRFSCNRARGTAPSWPRRWTRKSPDDRRLFDTLPLQSLCDSVSTSFGGEAPQPPAAHQQLDDGGLRPHYSRGVKADFLTRSPQRFVSAFKSSASSL